jgi:hypothetical protein
MTLSEWVRWALCIAAFFYLDTVWKRHSAATLDSPERRTLYDFFHTYPNAFLALFAIFVLTVTGIVQASR